MNDNPEPDQISPWIAVSTDEVVRVKNRSLDLAAQILADEDEHLTPNERLRWEAYRYTLLAMPVTVPPNWPQTPGHDCPHCGKEVPF